MAPGRDTFQAETGIRQGDWQGVFWARWSDAIRDAGLEPNTLRGAMDRDLLFTTLARLTRKLGHLPTRYELELERRTDRTVPTFTVFTRRIATGQAERAAKLRDFCAERPELADVAELCAKRVADEPADQTPPHLGSSPLEVLGAVYLFKSGRYYKIGRSNAAGRRERELIILMPEKGETVHAINTDDPAGIEAYWHRRFDAKRRNGEWFDLDAADVRTFKRRRFM